jgi:hypothetical protein
MARPISRALTVAAWATTGAGRGAAGAAGRGAAETGAAAPGRGAAGAAAGAAMPIAGADGPAAAGPPGGNVGSLMVGAAEGFGGKLMRTVSFLGWTLPVSFLGGTAPAGTFGILSAIKLACLFHPKYERRPKVSTSNRHRRHRRHARRTMGRGCALGAQSLPCESCASERVAAPGLGC